MSENHTGLVENFAQPQWESNPRLQECYTWALPTEVVRFDSHCDWTKFFNQPSVVFTHSSTLISYTPEYNNAFTYWYLTQVVSTTCTNVCKCQAASSAIFTDSMQLDEVNRPWCNLMTNLHQAGKIHNLQKVCMWRFWLCRIRRQVEFPTWPNNQAIKYKDGWA